MSITRFNNAEGGTSGTTATVANSGGASGYAVDGVAFAPSFDNAQAFSGSLSYKFTMSASQSNFQWSTPQKGHGTWWTRQYVRLSGAVFAVRLLTVSSAVVSVTALGKLQAALGTAGTTTATLLADTWYRIECQVNYDTSVTANNLITVRLYDAAGTLTETISSQSISSTMNPASVQFGATANATGTMWFDAPALSDQGWVGTATSFPVSKANNQSMPGLSDALTVNKTNSTSTGNDGTDVTATNAAFTYSWNSLRAGSSPFAFRATGTSLGVYQWSIPGTLSPDIYVRYYVFMPSSVSGLMNRMKGSDGTTLCSVQFSAAKLTASAGASNVTGSYTASVNTWYRVEGRYHIDASAGLTEAYLYSLSGDQLDHVTSGTAANDSASTVVFCEAVAYYDSLAMSDTGWIGPAGDIPSSGQRRSAMFMDIMG